MCVCYYIIITTAKITITITITNLTAIVIIIVNCYYLLSVITCFFAKTKVSNGHAKYICCNITFQIYAILNFEVLNLLSNLLKVEPMMEKLIKEHGFQDK